MKPGMWRTGSCMGERILWYVSPFSLECWQLSKVFYGLAQVKKAYSRWPYKKTIWLDQPSICGRSKGVDIFLSRKWSHCSFWVLLLMHTIQYKGVGSVTTVVSTFLNIFAYPICKIKNSGNGQIFVVRNRQEVCQL